jgi:restriction endonuclease Mrr
VPNYLGRRAAYVASVSPRVILVNGERLAELMIDHNVGVSDREASP